MDLSSVNLPVKERRIRRPPLLLNDDDEDGGGRTSIVSALHRWPPGFRDDDDLLRWAGSTVAVVLPSSRITSVQLREAITPPPPPQREPLPQLDLSRWSIRLQVVREEPLNWEERRRAPISNF
jgi:hypothetical protein